MLLSRLWRRDIQSGKSLRGNAPGAAVNASFPPSFYGAVAIDRASGMSFHYGGVGSGAGWLAALSNDTYVSTDGLQWAKATYAASSPLPKARLYSSIVTTSSTASDGSFLLVGGIEQYTNFTSTALVWKSSAVSGKSGVREWTIVGSTLNATGGGFLHISSLSTVLVDRRRLDGKDILYALGAVNSDFERSSSAVWASSDEGATWVQLTTASSVGAFSMQPQ